MAALLGASFLFGATFVVIKSALVDIGPLTFVGWRFLLGALALALFAAPRGRAIWAHGSLCGLALFAGYALQTAGLSVTSATNSALITGLYVVLTPFLAALFQRRRPSVWVVAAAAFSFLGLVLVTGTGDVAMSRGDLLTLGCAFAFALHIVALSRYARLHPVVPFTTVQLAVTAALSFPLAFALEGVTTPDETVWAAIALTGLGVSAGAFLLQIWAQTILGAATAAVVLAAEPAFAVATAWVVLGERLDLGGWIGAGLIVAAIYIAVTRQRDRASAAAESVTPAH
ncbi:MAG: DMT family transporter [Actinobacteria bacterium]|nr:DMT family transporter [Actinomycetota bacterium]